MEKTVVAQGYGDDGWERDDREHKRRMEDSNKKGSCCIAALTILSTGGLLIWGIGYAVARAIF